MSFALARGPPHTVNMFGGRPILPDCGVRMQRRGSLVHMYIQEATDQLLEIGMKL